MKPLIENHFNTVLFVSVVVGLTLPGLESTPNIVVSVLMGIMVFFLCAKISFSEIQGIAVTEVTAFYLIRYIGLPIALYYLANAVIPQYAVGILLLALMPSAITTPILVGTQKGNVSLAFILMVTSSLLAPFVISAVFSLSSAGSDIQVSALFYTLVSVVLVPFTAYFLVVSVRKQSKPFIESNSSFVSVLFMGVIIAIVVSKQKGDFLSDFGTLFLVVGLLSLAFLLFYLFGWFFTGRRGDRAQKISYSLSSGATNTALGINLALVTFSADTVFFMVLSEFLWVVSIPIFNTVHKKFGTQ